MCGNHCCVHVLQSRFRSSYYLHVFHTHPRSKRLPPWILVGAYSLVWNRSIVNRHRGNRINTGETGKHRQGLCDSRLISRRTRSRRGTVSYQGAPFICTPSTLDPLARVSCFSEQFSRPLIYLKSRFRHLISSPSVLP